MHARMTRGTSAAWMQDRLCAARGPPPTGRRLLLLLLRCLLPLLLLLLVGLGGRLLLLLLLLLETLLWTLRRERAEARRCLLLRDAGEHCRRPLHVLMLLPRACMCADVPHSEDCRNKKRRHEGARECRLQDALPPLPPLLRALFHRGHVVKVSCAEHHRSGQRGEAERPDCGDSREPYLGLVE